MMTSSDLTAIFQAIIAGAVTITLAYMKFKLDSMTKKVDDNTKITTLTHDMVKEKASTEQVKGVSEDVKDIKTEINAETNR